MSFLRKTVVLFLFVILGSCGNQAPNQTSELDSQHSLQNMPEKMEGMLVSRTGGNTRAFRIHFAESLQSYRYNDLLAQRDEIGIVQKPVGYMEVASVDNVQPQRVIQWERLGDVKFYLPDGFNVKDTSFVHYLMVEYATSSATQNFFEKSGFVLFDLERHSVRSTPSRHSVFTLLPVIHVDTGTEVIENQFQFEKVSYVFASEKKTHIEPLFEQVKEGQQVPGELQFVPELVLDVESAEADRLVEVPTSPESVDAKSERVLLPKESRFSIQVHTNGNVVKTQDVLVRFDFDRVRKGLPYSKFLKQPNVAVGELVFLENGEEMEVSRVPVYTPENAVYVQKTRSSLRFVFTIPKSDLFAHENRLHRNHVTLEIGYHTNVETGWALDPVIVVSDSYEQFKALASVEPGSERSLMNMSHQKVDQILRSRLKQKFIHTQVEAPKPVSRLETQEKIALPHRFLRQRCEEIAKEADVIYQETLDYLRRANPELNETQYHTGTLFSKSYGEQSQQRQNLFLDVYLNLKPEDIHELSEQIERVQRKLMGYRRMVGEDPSFSALEPNYAENIRLMLGQEPDSADISAIRTARTSLHRMYLHVWNFREFLKFRRSVL